MRIAWNKWSKEKYLKCIIEKHKDKNNLSFDKVDYTGMNNYVIISCKKHGDYKYKASSVLTDKFQCKFCNRENRHYKIAKKHCDDFLKIAKEKFSNIDYSIVKPNEDAYNNIFYIKCKYHGIQKVFRYTFLKHGCPRCDDGIHTGKAVNRQYTNDEFINELQKIYGTKYDYSEVKYLNWTAKVKLKCYKHGWFYREPARLIHDVRGCPYCNKSLLEDKLQKFLEEKNVKYIRQFSNKCLGFKRLDFYLPEYNVAIECQGSQHYKETNYYGGKKKLERQIEEDFRKFNLCKENGMRLLYYTDYKGEIPELYRSYTFLDKDKLLEEIKLGSD